jgi:SAM-dependent methyltransferase
MRESFQPIPVRPRSEARLQFIARCVLDLQFLTIHRFLEARLTALSGSVLDVGAGEAPWREYLGDAARYTGIDVERADDFGMRRDPAIVYYDGKVMPFPDGSFDHVLCVEVLEHVGDPRAFAAELARVLRPGGTLLMTVPWSARLHHLPHDFHRFTRFGLEALLRSAGFVDVAIEERGNDVAAIANKTLVATIALLRAYGLGALWRWPLALFTAPVAVAFVAAAHVAIACRLGSSLDPLGYGVVALRA